MLCASTLAALEAATPVKKRVLPPSDEVASESSDLSYPSSEDAPTSTVSTVSASSLDSIVTVGVPRDFSGHADGTARAYDSAEKWIMAALRSLDKDTPDLLLPAFDPNIEVCSDVHSTIAHWHTAQTTARDAGVIDDRPSAMDKSPPQECLVKARGWLLRFVNQRRAENRLPPLVGGLTLAGHRADAKAVNQAVKKTKAASGTLYHHKHDMAPSREQLTSMCYSGFAGDQRIDAEVLDSLEAGMAVALYLPTGARGSELKKMHLQSLGHESIQDERSGLTFECLKLTAFETKTKDQHLNQILPNSNPWRCGVAQLGLSLLVRRKYYGAPPFTMKTNEHSWKIFGTNVETLDRRIKEVFKIAGIRRQSGDPLTYLGRHHGTRLLQHAGGSAEGGAARRGHSNGTASYHYTECPLPDLHRLAGNDPDKPFMPAHLQLELYPLADAVLMLLFPELDAHEKAVAKRQREVDAMRGNADKIRTEEQLNDQERLTRAIRMACRTALCCLVARPRTWVQWKILENEGTVWQRATETNHRVVVTLFAGNKEAIEAMNVLAVAVVRLEQAEITARMASPENAITTAVVSAVHEVRQEAAADRASFQAVLERLMSIRSDDAAPLALPPPPSEAVPAAPPVPSAAIVAASCGARLKYTREQQSDVVPFSTWHNVSDALEYARTDLAPQEREQGRKWRVLVRTDGREDKARDKQWRNYCTLAIAVGLLTRGGTTYEDAVTALQSRLDAFGVHAHTPLLRSIGEEIKNIRDRDAIAKEVLGY
ncbi:hypothetical protein OAO87_00105 [bacterium]|nr:hypothetical protein [bacterium]